MANVPVSSGTTSASSAVKTDYRAMSILTTLFFLWGFLTSLNDVLIPHLKAIFSLNYAEAMLVQFAFFSTYFFISLPASGLIEKLGYKRAMVGGLLLMSLGCFLFVPAASVAVFAVFLVALVLLATGITILQVSANPYVSVIGPPETASSRLNLTQAFNSLGTTLAPLFGSALILAGAHELSNPKNATALQLQAYRVQQASLVKLPYIELAVVLLLVAIGLGMLHLPKLSGIEDTAQPGGYGDLLRTPHVSLGALAIFTYVGAEVSIGSFLTNYLHRPEIANMTLAAAANYVAYYWGGAMIGRFIGSGLLQKVKTSVVLAISAFLATALVLASMLAHGPVAMWTILAVGLFNSTMFPSIFTLGIAQLGPLTSKGSGLLIMAIVGGAIIPVLQGFIADRVGIHHAFLLPLLCYAYIAYYALSGSRVRRGFVTPPVQV